MKLHKYITLNIISVITIVNVTFLIFSAYNIIPKTISEIIFLYTKFGIVLIFSAFALIEFHIRHEKPNLLPDISIKNNVFEKFHIFIFYLGLIFACTKLILFCIFPFLLFSVWELPI